MNTTRMRVAAGFTAAFVLGLAVATANGLNLAQALVNSLLYGLIVGLIIFLMSWGMDTAVKKGYSPLLGLLLVGALNVVGALVVLMLPDKTKEKA